MKPPERFSGGQPEKLSEWVISVRNYLSLFGTSMTDEHKVMVASTYLCDLAKAWWMSLNIRAEQDQDFSLPANLEAFFAAMNESFIFINPIEVARMNLDNLRQGNRMTLSEYIRKFKEYIARLGGYNDADSIYKFLKGLTSETMRKDIMLQKPNTLSDAFSIASNIERSTKFSKYMVNPSVIDTDLRQASRGNHNNNHGNGHRNGGRAVQDNAEGELRVTKFSPRKKLFKRSFNRSFNNSYRRNNFNRGGARQFNNVSSQNARQAPSFPRNSAVKRNMSDRNKNTFAKFNSRDQKPKEFPCHICGRAGHWANECPQRLGTQGGNKAPRFSMMNVTDSASEKVKAAYVQTVGNGSCLFRTSASP